LHKAGAQAFAISEAFSVDDPINEKKALAVAQEMGLPASAGSEISQLYGLAIRTRTAVLNASMLPKMLETANLTEQCVRQAGITAPLMIMRSDGGVMDIQAMRRRPILTMLSGPAAGVAAAMMFLRISDGIFIEVGGTSTDISVIKNGRAQVRSAEIGGARIFMRTLDVRTVGVAGGSMARINHGKVIDVGPRSAHIAGLKYISFAEAIENPTVKLVSPMSGDPSDYVTIATQPNEEPRFCLTTTCAANLLELVPIKDCAFSKATSIAHAFNALGKLLNKEGKQCAEEFLSAASAKCQPIIKTLIRERKLDEHMVILYGGGGGGAAIVPYLAKRMNMSFELADSADVLSAIGVALALLHETVERQIINPSQDDILRIRQEARAALESMGATPSSIEVFIEIDPQTSTVRATATGATSMTEKQRLKGELSTTERIELVCRSMQLPIAAVKLTAESDYFQVFTGDQRRKSLFGLIEQRNKPVRALDRNGSIRFQCRHGEATITRAKEADKAIVALTNKLSNWGDAGRSIPNIVLFAGTKIVDLSGLLSTEQVLSLSKAELDNVPLDSPVIVVATPS
jgi:N-methylhydantoinase A/oxoprolinase/acetone carboxylase beta subunit